MTESGVESCGPHEPLIAPRRKCVCPKVRTVGSKAAVLVVMWTYLVYVACISIAHYGVAKNLHVYHAQVAKIGLAIAALLGPVAGLVASAYFGRYKVVYTSLWLMWSGVIAMVIDALMLQFSEAITRYIAFPGEIIGATVFSFGFIAFSVNSVPFGLDQMPDASSEQLSAFIHWYTWSVLAAAATTRLLQCVHLCVHIPSISTLKSFLSAASLTLTLCSIFVLRRWLTIEPESRNPLKTIFNVLRFAAEHKVPVRRSAFTYWEPRIPSRINLGKSKYGGPFTNEEVEDVKTFFRMLVVICSISVIICSVTASASTYHSLFVMLNYHHTHCDHSLLEVMVVVISLAIFTLPIHDVVIRPTVNRCRPSTLKRAGLAQLLVVCASMIALAVSVVWYKTQSSDHCMLLTDEGLSPFPVDYKWTIVALMLTFLFIIFLFFFSMAMLEFVCAQAPYNLRGLLVGMLPSIVSSSGFLASAIQVIWKNIIEHQGSGGSVCGIWFYLFTTTTAILGCVMWCVVAKWYKKREREEVDMCRIFAENYYDH